MATARNPYKKADAALETARKYIIKIFDENRGLAGFDDLNIIKRTKVMYDDIETFCRKMFLKVAKQYYKEYSNDTDDKAIDFKWLAALLKNPNPVSRYAFLAEWERKRGRFSESLAARGANAQEDYDRGMRLLNGMISAYVLIVADSAVMEAYRSSGVQKVRWATLGDGKVCKICEERDGQSYDIGNVPNKPHLYCRCWLEPDD